MCRCFRFAGPIPSRVGQEHWRQYGTIEEPQIGDRRVAELAAGGTNATRRSSYDEFSYNNERGDQATLESVIKSSMMTSTS
jgi:hypothetical protein